MPDYTYETGTDEWPHPDPTVISRLVEVGMSTDCEYGCKIYGDPLSNVKILAHSQAYGCNVTARLIKIENEIYARWSSIGILTGTMV